MLEPQSVEIIVGRLDAKRTGELPEWLRSACMKREQPLREGLSDDVA